GCNENATSSNDQYLTDPDISEQTKKPSRPIIDEKNKGVTDTSVTIEWDKIECEKNFSHYNVIVYRKDRIEDVITIRTRNNSVFIDDLKPNSQYSIDVSSCLHSACSESAKIEFITLNEIDYYHTTEIEKNVYGSLEGEVRFVQTHVISPEGRKNEPEIITGRDALILFKPSIKNSSSILMKIYSEDGLTSKVVMKSPSMLPKTDQPIDIDENNKVVSYSNSYWSAEIPWNKMKSGMSLHFEDENGNLGIIESERIKFSAPSELIIQNIDLGMLYKPRGRNIVIKELERTAVDYFQKVPVSKLIFSDYTPIHFEKITLPNGTVYTEKSADIGGWHQGDMREAVGKALVSTGINNANLGIVASSGYSQQYNRLTNHITAHTNIGYYNNGVVVHGGSGGGGIVTLENTLHNEWSHELGHNYGLGHYVAGGTSHGPDTSWGWDGYYKRFIANFDWKRSPQSNIRPDNQEVVKPFMDKYTYLWDAMSGGYDHQNGIISRYTLHHPYVARIIQDWLKNGAVVINNDYMVWDELKNIYVYKGTNFKVPIKKGVPVVTILGVYDPDKINPSQLYPPTYSNYGNIFDLEKPRSESSLKGWQYVKDVNYLDRVNTHWHTMLVNRKEEKICRFSYLSPKGKKFEFLGYEDIENKICTGGRSIHYLEDGKKNPIESKYNDYFLLSIDGDGEISYVPDSTIGESKICSLKMSGTVYGAGFIKGNSCRQIDGVFMNGFQWAFTLNQSGVNSTYTWSNECVLKIKDKDNNIESISIPNYRIEKNQSNKIHLNISREKPIIDINVYCGEHELTSIKVSDNPDIKLLKGPIIVGQEHGYTSYEPKLPSGWFKHYDNFEPKNEINHELGKMRVNDNDEYICRFNFSDSDREMKFVGYVSQLSESKYICT
ncbi:TPA: M66 family metalloprotease, partial [Vibrio cholerae]